MRVSFTSFASSVAVWANGPMSPGYRVALPGQMSRMTKQNHSSNPP